MAEPAKIVYVGRLEKDTGLPEFLRWLKQNKSYTVDFCGDGSLRGECEKFGNVHGFVDPKGFLKEAKFCVPGGYLAFLEAKSLGIQIKIFASGQLRKDYWIGIEKVKKVPTWAEVADVYLGLYHRFK